MVGPQLELIHQTHTGPLHPHSPIVCLQEKVLVVEHVGAVIVDNDEIGGAEDNQVDRLQCADHHLVDRAGDEDEQHAVGKIFREVSGGAHLAGLRCGRLVSVHHAGVVQHVVHEGEVGPGLPRAEDGRAGDVEAPCRPVAVHNPVYTVVYPGLVQVEHRDHNAGEQCTDVKNPQKLGENTRSRKVVGKS